MAKTEAVAVMACLALALLRKVESPALRVSCDPGEFPHSGICCKLCPAGTHVEEFCTFPHTLGTCKSCIDGENFTNFDNGLQHCFSCIDCKPGYKMVAPCTRKKNTQCQCSDGYFCPSTCEECTKCKTRCPEGQVIIQSCNATTDMKCGPRNPEASDSSFATILYIVASGFSVFFLMVIAYIIYKRRKSSSVMKKENKESTDHLIPNNNENINSTTEATAASQDRLPETLERENLEMGSREQDNALPNSPSVPSSLEVACSNGQCSGTDGVQRPNKPAVRINTSRMETLKETYLQIKDMVGPNNWNLLMRKCGLEDNDIDSIKNDYAYNSEEQRYRMLKTLLDRNGVVAAFHKIFASLQEMNLNGIYESLIKELESKDLIIKKTED